MSSKENIEALKFFNEKAARLQKCSFTRIIFGQDTGATFSIEQEGAVTIEQRGPGQEAIDAFVLTFRFFIQDNEKSSFRKMAAVYESLSVSEEIKEKFKNARQYVNQMLESKSLIDVDGYHFSRREIMEIFIYGGLSHANEYKKREYDKWMNDPFIRPVVYTEFMFVLGRILQVIMDISWLNNHVLEELETVEQQNP